MNTNKPLINHLLENIKLTTFLQLRPNKVGTNYSWNFIEKETSLLIIAGRMKVWLPNLKRCMRMMSHYQLFVSFRNYQ